MTFAIPCRAALAVVAALLVQALPLPASSAADIYSVSGVPVDVVAQSTIQAREQAVAQGQREGLRRLLQRLTTQAHYGQLPDVDSIDMTPLVRSFGVENERLSSNRYIAEVTATYHGPAVQQLLQGRGVPIVLESSPTLLVVPARRIDGRMMVFARDDPFTEAWARGFNRNTLLDVVLPIGDLLDVRQLPLNASNEQINAGLAVMAERYAASGAVLLVAEGDPELGGQVTVSRDGSYGWSYGFSGFGLAAIDESVWPQAVVASMRRLEEPWKSDALVRFDAIEALTITAPLADLDAWAHIRSVLDAMAEVRDIDLRAFSQAQAVLRIRFVGGLSQLQRSFENRGLRLAEETGQWQLQRAGSRTEG